MTIIYSALLAAIAVGGGYAIGEWIVRAIRKNL